MLQLNSHLSVMLFSLLPVNAAMQGTACIIFHIGAVKITLRLLEIPGYGSCIMTLPAC